MRKLGLYPGRFQPFLLKHLGIVEQILDNYPIDGLTVLIADWKGEPNKKNFLRGEESAILARWTIDYVKLGKLVDVRTIPLSPEIPSQDPLQVFLGEHKIDIVFCGSSGTLEHCYMLASKFGFAVMDLCDDDEVPPRARDVREAMTLSSRDGWEHLVVPRVAEFLKQPSIRERFQSLGEGNKRPWSNIERR